MRPAFEAANSHQNHGLILQRGDETDKVLVPEMSDVSNEVGDLADEDFEDSEGTEEMAIEKSERLELQTVMKRYYGVNGMKRIVFPQRTMDMKSKIAYVSARNKKKASQKDSIKEEARLIVVHSRPFIQDEQDLHEVSMAIAAKLCGNSIDEPNFVVRWKTEIGKCVNQVRNKQISAIKKQFKGE